MNPLISAKDTIWCVLILFVLGVLSCNGEEDEGDIAETTTLKVMLLDNPVSNQPFPGGYVILHGEDNRSVERSIRTDHTGVADFGDIGRTRATFTIAWEWTMFVRAWRQLRTFQNVRVGDTALYVFHYEGEVGDHIATIDVTLTGAPARTDSTVLLPFNWIQSYSDHNPLSEFRDVTIHDLHIQKNGKVSLLACAFEGPTVPGNLLTYGFLLDQEVVEGTEYEILIDQEPGSVNWRTEPSKTLSLLSAVGEYKGVTYPWEISVGEHISEGTLLYPAEFPMDHYWFHAYHEAGDLETGMTRLQTHKRYDKMPHTVGIEMPDYRLHHASYDDHKKRVSWSLSGQTEKDAVTLRIDILLDDETWTNWIVHMRPQVVEWTTVDLPSPIDEWVNPALGEAVTLSVSDYDACTSYDSYWKRLPDLMYSYEDLSRIYHGSYLVYQDLGNLASRIR